MVKTDALHKRRQEIDSEDLFIRHGDPDYINDTLTKKGHREAKLLAEGRLT